MITLKSAVNNFSYHPEPLGGVRDLLMNQFADKKIPSVARDDKQGCCNY